MHEFNVYTNQPPKENQPMTTTETTEAEQVARSYAATIRTMEDIADIWGECPSAERLTETAQELAEELAEHPERFTINERFEQRSEIDRMMKQAEWITENLPDHEEGDPYAASYVSGALEVTYRGYYDSEDRRWHPDEVHVLVAYGGPSVRVIAHDNNNHVTIRAAWWSDNAEVTTYAPHLAEYLQANLDWMPL
jgi:hypothetical protein